jgi:hypothetical protein
MFMIPPPGAFFDVRVDEIHIRQMRQPIRDGI